MKKIAWVLSLIGFAFSTLVLAAEFKPYPGAKIDEKATKESRKVLAEAGMTNTKSTIYTTGDSFEKVFAFYNKMAKEYKMPSRGEGVKRLPSGQELKEAFFIFDGAPDITTSKLWIKIQRPYIGKVTMGKNYEVKYEDIRDVTAITVSEQK